MKQLSSIDVHFVVKELQFFVDARIDKIFARGKEEVALQMYKSNEGKKILRFIVGKALFAATHKEADEEPSGFCMALRKHLDGVFLRSIVQLEPERIVKLVFESKQEKKHLYLEVFGKGNVVLCSSDDVIIDCLIQQTFRDRKVRPKQPYTHPAMKHNIFSMAADEVFNTLQSSKKDSLVTCLATDLGVGGMYAEELCLRAGIDKQQTPAELTEQVSKKIENTLKKILKEKVNASIVYDEKNAIRCRADISGIPSR